MADEMLDELEAALDSFAGGLSWQKRNPSLPTSRKDRQVLRLVYGPHQTEMGLVCERADGTYWCLVTGEGLSSLPTETHLDPYASKDAAAKVLHKHVLSELLRLYRLRVPVFPRGRFKARDKRICAAEKASVAGFKAGAEWILQSEGFPRRPEWAKYLVQNADGSFVWFEQQPELLSGKWLAQGLSQQVKLADRLSSSIVRLR